MGIVKQQLEKKVTGNRDFRKSEERLEFED